ncbi:MAG: hypothetical protein HC915_15820 [Anaerolineae bacterium]|nr:hypothetical protein [Anaerolineae bacterium]
MVNWRFQTKTLPWLLKRYLASPHSQVAVEQNPLFLPRPQVLPGAFGERLGLYQQDVLLIDFVLDGEPRQLAFVQKCALGDPLPTHVEALLLRRAPEWLLFLVIPRLLADGAPGKTLSSQQLGEWLLLELLEDLRPPEAWTLDDYREAMRNLALLHNRFWELEEDLEVMGLQAPLGKQFAASLAASQQATQQLLAASPAPEWLKAPRYRQLLHTLAAHLQEVAAPLQAQPMTLIHGDYWPDNLAASRENARQKVTGWHAACIGPAILDVVHFQQQTRVLLPTEHPLELLTALYLANLEDQKGCKLWSTSEWATLHDWGLLWWVATRWLPWLAACPPETSTPLLPFLQAAWLEPAALALQRRLNIRLAD